MRQDAFTDDDLLPISALQHLLFCERQCALIHVERVWVENRWTAEGRQLRKRAHDAPSETRDGVRITRGLPLRSFALGLAGVADVVNWTPPGGPQDGRTLAHSLRHGGEQGWAGWTITPIEYKRGKPKPNDCDRVQLCAQALCLEEMLGTTIEAGEIFYGRNRRRTAVALDAPLRGKTVAAARRLHELLASGRTPSAVREKKCETCSLLPICLPSVAAGTRSAQRFLDRTLAGLLAKTDFDST
jgi:CRISPR-associated exonuclease Cas4